MRNHYFIVDKQNYILYWQVLISHFSFLVSHFSFLVSSLSSKYKTTTINILKHKYIKYMNS